MIVDERDNGSFGEIIHNASPVDQKQGIGATSGCCCCCSASSVAESDEE